MEKQLALSDLLPAPPLGLVSLEYLKTQNRKHKQRGAKLSKNKITSLWLTSKNKSSVLQTAFPLCMPVRGVCLWDFLCLFCRLHPRKSCPVIAMRPWIFKRWDGSSSRCDEGRWAGAPHKAPPATLAFGPCQRRPPPGPGVAGGPTSMSTLPLRLGPRPAMCRSICLWAHLCGVGSHSEAWQGPQCQEPPARWSNSGNPL